MTTKHSPLIRLQAARRDLDAARELCMHWDFEDDGAAGCECCYRVDDAKRELRAAKKATEGKVE